MTGPRKDRLCEFEKIWRAMTILQEAYGSFAAPTVMKVVEFAGIDARAVRAYVDFLHEIRAIEYWAAQRRLRIVNAGDAPPMPVTAYGSSRAVEQSIWTAMRSLRAFRPLELAAAATTEERPVTPAEAALYCKSLCRAGYLALIDRATYRLMPSGNTGPRAPMVVCSSNHRSLFDLNLMQTVNVTGRRTVRRAA